MKSFLTYTLFNKTMVQIIDQFTCFKNEASFKCLVVLSTTKLVGATHQLVKKRMRYMRIIRFKMEMSGTQWVHFLKKDTFPMTYLG